MLSKVRHFSPINMWLFLFVFYSTVSLDQIRASENDNNIVIELAIVCDVGFSTLFQGDRENLEKYWGALVFDAHKKFETVQGVNISFRVNSIVALEDLQDQQFIEKVRTPSGSIPASEVLSGFGAWMHEKAIKENFTGYDVAVLAVSSTFSDGVVGMAKKLGGACSVDAFKCVVESIIILTMRHTDPGDTLAHEIAHFDAFVQFSCRRLNAPHDNEENYKEHGCGDYNATEHKYLMANSGEHQAQQYQFSPCSQRQITEFLQTDKAHCLKQIYSHLDPIFDTSDICDQTEFFGEVSLEKQCQIVVGNKNAYVTKGSNECFNVKCHLDLAPGLFSTYELLDPLEGTTCGEGDNAGYCYWGACVRWGGWLLNVATEQCLDYEYLPTDDVSLASLSNCLNTNAIRIDNATNNGVKITTLDFNGSKLDFGIQCLVVRKDKNIIAFEACKSYEMDSVWERRFFKNDSQEFLLIHRKSEQCLGVAENSTTLEMTTNCSSDSVRQQWKFLTDSEQIPNSKCNYRNASKNTKNVGAKVEAHFSGLQIMLLIILIFYLLQT